MSFINIEVFNYTLKITFDKNLLVIYFSLY